MSPSEWPDLAKWWAIANVVSRQKNLYKYFYQSKPSYPICVIAGQAQATYDMRLAIIDNLNDIYDSEIKQQIADIILHQWIMNKTFEHEFDPHHVYPSVELIKVDLGVENLFKPGCTLDRVVSLIHQISARRQDANTKEKARIVNNNLTYGAYLNINITVRIQELIKIAGVKAAAAVIMRYLSVADPLTQSISGIDYILGTFKILNEAFTSPINSHVFDIPDGQFFSEFPDTDGVFGSCGSIFKNALAESRPGNWLVVPPGIPAVITRSVLLFDACMNSVPKTVVYIIYKSFIDILKTSTHICENGIIPIFNNRYMVILSSEKIKVTPNMIRRIRSDL
jgi:hypothetical protein